MGCGVRGVGFRVQGAGFRVQGSGVGVGGGGIERRLQSGQNFQSMTHVSMNLQGGKACLLLCKYDHFSPTREIRRHVRALARNYPEGWNLQRHVSPAAPNSLTSRIGLEGLGFRVWGEGVVGEGRL